jgi:hypothetical protein
MVQSAEGPGCQCHEYPARLGRVVNRRLHVVAWRLSKIKLLGVGKSGLMALHPPWAQQPQGDRYVRDKVVPLGSAPPP